MPLYFGNATFANIGVTSNALGVPSPSNHLITAWTYDPVIAGASTAFTNGQPRLNAIYPSKTQSVTKIYWWVSGAGATPTAGQNEVGIYDSAGNKLVSANVDAAISSTGLKTTTVAATALQAGQFYWVAALFNATTPPSLAWAPSSAVAAAAGPINVGLGASNMRSGANGSALTALAATINPASNAQSGAPWYAVGP